MKTLKILTIITGMLLITTTGFSKEPNKHHRSRPERPDNQELYAFNDVSKDRRAELFEVRKAIHESRITEREVLDELRYNADGFVREEPIRTERWMTRPFLQEDSIDVEDWMTKPFVIN